MKNKFVALAVALFFCFQLIQISIARGEEYKPFEHVGQGFADTVNSKNLPILGIGLGLTVVSLYFDSRWSSYVSERNFSLGEVGNFAVKTKDWMAAAIGGFTVFYGQIFRDAKAVSSGQAQIEAVMSYSLTVNVLKFFTYRNGPGSYSLRHAFPSGEAYFVSAGSFAKMYGFASSLPFLALGSAAAVHYALIDGHWLSDLIFGSILGYAMGSAFADHHLSGQEQNGSKVSVFPVIDRQDIPDSSTRAVSYGVGLQVRY